MKKITSVSIEERTTIILMAGRGKTSVEIRAAVDKPVDVIRRVCKRDGVTLTPVFVIPRKEPNPAPVEPARLVVDERHALERLGEGLKPFDRSIAIMKHFGRYSSQRQGEYPIHLLDGKSATPYQFVTEASRELVKRGYEPIGIQWG